jgi:DNA polymerase III epsilon subunit-like protein
MNYIVFDLEFNQDFKPKTERSSTTAKCPFEILQIGAIKLDVNLNTISTFNKLVKPEIFTELHPYIKEMTGVTLDKLNEANSFKVVYKDFLEFIKSDKPILCVWGLTDIKELYRNALFHSLDTASIPKECINIQSHASKHFNFPRGVNIGLSNAVGQLNIPLTHPFHNAYFDAFYTAEIFRELHGNNIKIINYDPYNKDKFKQAASKNHIIDTNNLFKQFEKMYKRKLTNDEKTMIKLSYMMGKTNQFTIDVEDK